MVSQISSIVQLIVILPPVHKSRDWFVKSLVTVGEPPVRVLIIILVWLLTHVAISASKSDCATVISSLSKSHALVFLLEGSVKLIPSGCVNVYVALKLIV